MGGDAQATHPNPASDPPLSSAARRTHASTHARFARFDSHMLLPTQRFWAGPVSREHGFLGTTVLLSRCELALQSFHLQLRTRCSTTVYGLDHGGGGSCVVLVGGGGSGWLCLHPFASLLPSLPSLHLASFPWAWAQGRVASTHLGTGIAPLPPTTVFLSLCNTEHGLISRRARHHRRSVARPLLPPPPPPHVLLVLVVVVACSLAPYVLTVLPATSTTFYPFHRHHRPPFHRWGHSGKYHGGGCQISHRSAGSGRDGRTGGIH